MLETLSDSVANSLVDALEQMAFISALPPESPLAVPTQALLIRIGFRGPVCGRIDLLADEAVGVLIACNVLGPDCIDAPFRARDALKELLNVTCGTFLAQYPPVPGQAFEMSIPEVQPLDCVTWESMLAQGDFAPFDAEGHALAIRLADRNPS